MVPVNGDVYERGNLPVPTPFRFSGEIERAIVDVSGEHVADYESEMAMALAKQ
jgi:hypothetical protein